MIETIPYRWYSDPEQLRREQERVFARTWQYVGRADEVAAPGSYATGWCGADFPLLPVSVDTWGPFLFANPDPEAAPLAEALGGLSELLAQVVDVDALRLHSRARFGVEANWKVAAENFLECYHCATVHPEFAAQVDVHPERYVLDPHETFAAQACRARDGGGAGQFHLLYPNTGVNVFPGPANLSIGPLLPAGPDRTERFLDYFFAPDAEPGWIEEFLAYDDRIGAEDAAMVASVHRGMRSGLLERGSLLGGAERLIAGFQAWLRGQLDD